MRELRVVITAAAALLAAAGTGACGGNGEAETPEPTPGRTTSVTPTPGTAVPTATATSSLEDEVAAAYLAYWEAYAEAVLHLDVALVEDHAMGDELEGIRQEIAGYEADGVAARIRVEHDFVIVQLSTTEAVVIDEYVNNSFYVDPDTKQPEEAEGAGEVVRDTIHMQKVDGRWVVVRGTREMVE